MLQIDGVRLFVRLLLDVVSYYYNSINHARANVTGGKNIEAIRSQRHERI